MQDWDSFTTDERDANLYGYHGYLHARLLDFSRSSVWLLMILFLVGTAYYVIYYLYVYLLSPVVAPFVFALKQWAKGNKLLGCLLCRCCCGRSDDAESLKEYSEVAEQIAKNGMPTTYSMDSSTKYAAAYKAILHAADQDPGETRVDDV
jgi:hypothetical protein